MKCRTLVVLVAIAMPLAVSPAFAQDNFPPQLQIVRWDVLRFNGSFISFFDTVFDANDPAKNDPSLITEFIHQELDVVAVTIRITDQDWTQALIELNQQEVGEGEDPPEPPDYEETFVRFRAFQQFFSPRPPGFIGFSPNAPPIGAADENFFPEEDGFQPDRNFMYGDTPPPSRDLTLIFQYPEFEGKNQQRIDPNNPLDVDVGYALVFEVANDQDPERVDKDATIVDVSCTAQEPVFFSSNVNEVGGLCVFTGVIENPALGPPNPPSFPDATASSRIVETGSTVILDGTRTFDSFNTGFDPDDPFVFEKDRIEFTWEWLSGPVRVEPVQSSQNDPIATVKLDVVGTYVFRLLVDDGVQVLPNAETVEITVVEDIQENRPPLAFISGPTESVPVGAIITLDGSDSFDEDGDPLTFRWKQTNAIGGDLEPDELVTAFQPLSGLEDVVSTWQAVTPGRFFFRLLASDGDFVASATFAVDVFQPETGGVTQEANGATGSTANTDTQQPPAGSFLAPACGFGLAPVGLVPLGIVALRRRRR